MITYVAINLTNKKFQVGSTTNFKNRQKQHLKGKGNLPFHRSLLKDPTNFFWLVGEDDGLETRDEEQYYLNFYYGSMWCYNMSPSSVGGLCSTPEQLSKAGKISKEKRVGVHAASAEQLSEWAKKGLSSGGQSRGGKTSGPLSGKKTLKEGKGIFGRDTQTHREDSRKGGESTRNNESGWFSMTAEEKTARSRKAAANTNSQKWMDPYDGYTGNAGNVATHMRLNGRDPTEKMRLS